MMFRIVAVSILALLHLPQAKAQGCSNQCPPLNAGTPVPSLCEGDSISDNERMIEKLYTACHPTPSYQFRFNDFKRPGQVTVISNYYSGCNAGRRESGVFAQVAQRYYNKYGNFTMFVSSLKGGGTCEQWASIYQSDATSLYPEESSSVVPKEMPITVSDVDYEIRDDFFTTPFGHPAYVILDENLRVRHKFIGPCCGYESYYGCTKDIAKTLDETLSLYIDDILQEQGVSTTNESTSSPQKNETLPEIDNSTLPSNECKYGTFSDWSACSVSCGTSTGIQFRWRAADAYSSRYQCPTPVETRPCSAPIVACEDDDSACIWEFGNTWDIVQIASGFDSPRDVAFHPTPGLHLGSYSEGRPFNPNVGEEAWILNGNNHSISIVASLGTDSQTTISRRDRGYYHYMINATALAFNTVGNSQRSADRDSFNYWAVCNDNLNTYLGTKEPNYFQGPTLYNSDPQNRNIVNRLGEECKDDEPCYFLHSDMLHESPGCIGITHDPETVSSYGNVYWAFDATGDRQTGQLVRFDFQQPHGPGSMDHSVAAIRRYTEVKLERGDPGIHAGMVVHPERREIFISVPGANKVLVVNADSGNYARSAREEFPIYSSRLPSFEYSIWECVEQRDFAIDIKTPSGLALGPNGERLFVAERETGKILVYEIESGALVYSLDTGFGSIGGIAFSPFSEDLYFVDQDTNTLNAVKSNTICMNPISSRVSEDFTKEVVEARNMIDGQVEEGHFSLYRDYNCTVDPLIPDTAFFDQVHVNSGYASNNSDVQNDDTMDEEAALLANRSDCSATSELNFDALLLGGYFCHQCLPDARGAECDAGGQCQNVQWDGYLCDNEYIVEMQNGALSLKTANNVLVDPSFINLRRNVTYRFTVRGDDPVCIGDFGSSSSCATNAPLLWTTDEESPTSVFLHTEEGDYDAVSLSVPNEKTEVGDNITNNPTQEPTQNPTQDPTEELTQTPAIEEPTIAPTDKPTDEPVSSTTDDNGSNVPLIVGSTIVVVLALSMLVVIVLVLRKQKAGLKRQPSETPVRREKTSDAEETQSQDSLFTA